MVGSADVISPPAVFEIENGGRLMMLVGAAKEDVDVIPPPAVFEVENGGRVMVLELVGAVREDVRLTLTLVGDVGSLLEECFLEHLVEVELMRWLPLGPHLPCLQ